MCLRPSPDQSGALIVKPQTSTTSKEDFVRNVRIIMLLVTGFPADSCLLLLFMTVFHYLSVPHLVLSLSLSFFSLFLILFFPFFHKLHFSILYYIHQLSHIPNYIILYSLFIIIITVLFFLYL